MCKFVPNFIRRCVRDDPLLCWQNIGAGKYRTSRRLRTISAHFQTNADMVWHLTCNYTRNYGNHLYVKIEELKDA